MGIVRFLAVFTLVYAASVQAQVADHEVSRRHFIGSSGFMLFNALPEAPDFFQLNYGYWLTNKDVLSIEAITWKYNAPLGIPYGPAMGSSEEAYPGYVREFGVGAAYQRFIWRDLYVAGHALPLLQQYHDENGKEIQEGFQLFLTLRMGYHVRLFQDRFFIEPSVAATHWPINTNVPASFAEKDNKWPNYFLLEPGLHFGVKF